MRSLIPLYEIGLLNISSVLPEYRFIRRIQMKKVLFTLLLLFVITVPAFAKTAIDFPTGYGQEEFKNLSTDLGLALSYMPLSPAEPLGDKLPGFDAGVEVTYIPIDDEKPYWKLIKAAGGDDIPAALGFGKVHIQVGLPIIPIDFGYVYATLPDTDIRYTGYEIKYAILEGGVAMPALAVRGAYTKLSGVDVLEMSTKSVDLSISKGFAMLTPYAGIGQVWITSEEKDPDIALEKEDISETKVFVGAKLSLLPVLNVVLEGDFAAVNAYTFRLNLSF